MNLEVLTDLCDKISIEDEKEVGLLYFNFMD